jgi:hypothetical protein
MRARLIGNGLLTARVSDDVAALLDALQLQGASMDRLLALDDTRWRELLRYCDDMRLTLPLALRSYEQFPAWVCNRLRTNLADTAQRFPLVQAAYCEASAALAEAGVPFLVIKGFAQSPDFAKAPQFRMQGDIDFYVPREKAVRAVKALEAIGYEGAGPEEDFQKADHHPTLIRWGNWKWRENRFDPELPPALEVHHCLWNAAVYLIPLPEIDEFWNRRVDRKLGDFSFPALSAVDHFGYFSLHVLREMLSGGRALHNALELATFIHGRADDAAFWTEWQGLHSPRLRQVESIPAALASAAFSSRLPDALREQIDRLPAEQRAWIESCGGDMLAASFGRTRDGRLLQFMLSESPRTRRKILWRALLPGAIASPRRVGTRSGYPGGPRPGPVRLLWKYAAYVTSCSFFHGTAILRLVATGLRLWLSSFALRRAVRS